jgi:hypothetical protein
MLMMSLVLVSCGFTGSFPTTFIPQTLSKSSTSQPCHFNREMETASTYETTRLQTEDNTNIILTTVRTSNLKYSNVYLSYITPQDISTTLPIRY